MTKTPDLAPLETPASRPDARRSEPARDRPCHCFTVDVEEHFQVSVFESVVPRATWELQPSRVVRNTEVLLDLLAEHDTLGTFFVLGWVANRYPDLVKRIASQGHEIASHGWWHQRVTSLDRARFAEDVTSSKAVLEDTSGTPVHGFRAPSFSIVPGFEWAFDVLIEAGYRYDSSIFPIRRPGYGYPDAPRWPYRITRPSGELVEFPMTTWLAGPVRVPAAGGGYLRHFPFGVTRAAFRQAESRGGAGMFYIHPWEVDPEQPRLRVGPVTRIRHYHGLGRSLRLMGRLLSEFDFTSVRGWLEGNRV